LTGEEKIEELFEKLIIERLKLLQSIASGLQIVPKMLHEIVFVHLLDWRRKQKLSQIGCAFEKAEQALEKIQFE
jgi:hypothetical protein